MSYFRNEPPKESDVYLPDRETIRRECERIRATWSAETEQHRRVAGPPTDWQPPQCRIVYGNTHGGTEER